MSKENAVKFLEAVNRDSKLKKKVMDGSATTAAWVASAAAAGFHTTVDELRSVAEQLTGKPIKPDSLVGELRALFEGELNAENLDRVAGGLAGISANSLADRLSGISSATGTYVKEGGPMWSNDPKRFDPGGSQSNPAGGG